VIDRKGSIAPDDVVGYGRPPKATRFAPGVSGNPRGRPKGSRSVGAIIQAIFRQRVPITESGRTRRMPAVEVMLRRLRNDAMRGDAKAMRLFLSLLDRYAESPESAPRLVDLMAEDRAILAHYAGRSDGLAADPPLKRRKKGR
jgi:hypothetical protein